MSLRTCMLINLPDYYKLINLYSDELSFKLETSEK